MVTGLFAGALFALGTVILGMAMELPVYSTDLKVIFLAPYISNFLRFPLRGLQSIWARKSSAGKLLKV